MAKASLGFGRGPSARRFDALGQPAGGSPYSLYAGEPRGTVRAVRVARIAGPTRQ